MMVCLFCGGSVPRHCIVCEWDVGVVFRFCCFDCFSVWAAEQAFVARTLKV